MPMARRRGEGRVPMEEVLRGFGSEWSNERREMAEGEREDECEMVGEIKFKMKNMFGG